MAVNKCNWTVFSNDIKIKEIFRNKIIFKGQIIPYDEHPKFLGVYFDEKLTFEKHVNNLKVDCLNRLNQLKIISHKSWMLSKETLKHIYFSIIRSKIEYISFVNKILSELHFKKLEIIQNKALRIIFKPGFRTSNEVLLNNAKVEPVSSRISILFSRYIKKCLIYNNPLILVLIETFKKGFSGGRPHCTPLSEFLPIFEENETVI